MPTKTCQIKNPRMFRQFFRWQGWLREGTLPPETNDLTAPATSAEDGTGRRVKLETQHMGLDRFVHTGGPEPLRDDFLSVAIHELRTPLTVLKLQTQHLKKCLAREGLDDDAAILAQMEAQIQKLERLNGVLLDVSKNIPCKRITG